MVTIVYHLRSLGVTIFSYIDDWLIVADSVLTQYASLSLDLLCSLGIQVNWKKSSLTPTQEIQFTGARLDLLATRAILPNDRTHSIWQLIGKVQKQHSSPVMVIQKLLGHMAAAISVIPYATLHMKPLQVAF